MATSSAAFCGFAKELMLTTESDVIRILRQRFISRQLYETLVNVAWTGDQVKANVMVDAIMLAKYLHVPVIMMSASLSKKSRDHIYRMFNNSVLKRAAAKQEQKSAVNNVTLEQMQANVVSLHTLFCCARHAQAQLVFINNVNEAFTFFNKIVDIVENAKVSCRN
jgi:hypothetical protein